MSKQKHIAIKASKKSISSMILSILMLLSVIPLHSSTIFAESTKKTVMNGTGNIQKNDSIWFGIRGKDLTDAGSEIQWRVLDTNTNIGEDGLFLLSEKLIGKTPFHNRVAPSRKWQGSDAQKWCKDFSGENGDNSLKSLSDQELAAIKPTTESNPENIAPHVPFHPKKEYALNGDKVFFLSVGEAETYFQTNNERIATDGKNSEKWWLRSPNRGIEIRLVWIVEESGDINKADVKKNELATRPAFNLDTTKVLFTSPAVDGKQSNAAGDALKAVEDTDTTEWKLTLIDRNRTFQLDTDNGEKVTIAGNILTIPYKDATTGTNEYISAVVEKNGTITHYGNIKYLKNQADNTGTATVQLPADFDKTTDKLYLINEQLNGEKKTDYSSAKIEVEIPAQQPPQPTEYTVTMENDGNGKSMANPTKAKQGDIISINAEANKGFKFKEWQVVAGNPVSDNQVRFDKTDEDAKFKMPAEDVKIKATFGKLYKIDVEYDKKHGIAKATVDGVVGDIEEEIAGTKITLKATPHSGHKFVEWQVTTKTGVKVEPDNANSTTTTFIMPDEDVEIKAIFVQDQPPQPQPQEYTVTVKSNNTTMGKVAPDKVEHVAKDTVIVENGNKLIINGKEVIATAEPGYKFNNWTGIPQGKKVVADVEITANFERESQPPQPQPQEYTVTVKSNNTTMGKVAPDKVEHVAKDTVIVENGNKLTINGKEVIATAEPGYKFNNWTGIPQGKKVVADVEITANFERESQPPQPQPQEYTVTVKSNNTTMGKVAPDKVEHVAKDTVIVENGNKLTINGKEVVATAEPGYKFKNWTGIPQGKKVVADVEITANFERESQPPQPQPQEYTVTVKSNNTTMGKVAPDKVEHVAKDTVIVENGNKLTINGKEVVATAEPGYKFNNWTGIPQGKKVVADVEITANFERESQPPQPQPQEYTVTVKSNNTTMGKVAPDKVEHVAKDTVIVENGNKLTINGKEVIATAEPGYKFNNWTGIPQGKKVVADVEITANFERENQPPQPQPQEYTVTVKSNNTTMGKVAPDKVEHVAKDTVIVENGNKLTINGKEVIATAEPGYKFNNWTGIPQGKKVVADVEITANFERENQPPQPTKYKIKLTDDGNGTAKSMVGGVQVTEAEQGKKVTITAMPDRGYKFDEWRVLSGGIRLRDEDSATTTFTMPNRDVEIKAYFKKKSSGGSSHDAEYYNITTKTDRHGTVEARSKAREGTEVSVTVDPDKGYKLDEITVTDKRGRDITIKETNRENRYKFTMPARDVTVEATFKQIKQEQPSKPTTPPTIPPTNNNKPTENNIIKKQQTTVFTIGSNIMTVITDGKATQTTIDAKPFLSQGRVMIPVRYAAESLGMQVEWNKQTQTVVLKDRENTVMIPIKTNKIIVGNQEYTSDVTPILKNGRTYLTISNIAKALQMRAGQDVKWDNKIKQVTIIKEVEVR